MLLARKTSVIVTASRHSHLLTYLLITRILLNSSVHNTSAVESTDRRIVLDDSKFLWAFCRMAFFSAFYTPLLPRTPNDLFDQIWHKGVPFGTLVQTFTTPPQPPKI